MTVAPAPHIRRAGWVITIASLAAIAFATLSPQYGPTVNAHFCLVCGSVGGVNGILNIFLFVPLGIGLALSGVPGKRAIFAACVLSVLIEAAQLSIIPGRDSTIGDVITNTLGGALGFAIGQYATNWLRPTPRIARNLAIGWAAIWFAMQIISSYGFAPSLPESPYYGQIGRVFRNLAVFPGRVLTTGIDDVQIPNTALSDSRRARDLLLGGATVAATVLPAAPTPSIAPVVRVADTRQIEIALLAQDGESLVFDVRTGAAVLRLRPLVFALANAFPVRASSAARLSDDTLRLSGRYTPRGVTMGAESRSATHDRRVPLTASLGWTFWLPFQWYVEGTRSEIVIGCIWFASLVIPLGYWSVRLNESRAGNENLRQWSPVFLAYLALLLAGLALVPIAFGLSAAPLRDWLATLAGILIGIVLEALGRHAHPEPRADVLSPDVAYQA